MLCVSLTSLISLRVCYACAQAWLRDRYSPDDVEVMYLHDCADVPGFYARRGWQAVVPAEVTGGGRRHQVHTKLLWRGRPAPPAALTDPHASGSRIVDFARLTLSPRSSTGMPSPPAADDARRAAASVDSRTAFVCTLAALAVSSCLMQLGTPIGEGLPLAASPS